MKRSFLFINEGKVKPISTYIERDEFETMKHEMLAFSVIMNCPKVITLCVPNLHCFGWKVKPNTHRTST